MVQRKVWNQNWSWHRCISELNRPYMQAKSDRICNKQEPPKGIFKICLLLLYGGVSRRLTTRKNRRPKNNACRATRFSRLQPQAHEKQRADRSPFGAAPQPFCFWKPLLFSCLASAHPNSPVFNSLRVPIHCPGVRHGQHQQPKYDAVPGEDRKVVR